MGRLARVLDFVRGSRNGANLTDTKGDPGGGANIQAEHFGAPGDDAHPLPGDTFAAMTFRRSGSGAAVGYVDPKNRQTAQPGERRIYSRDAETGDEVAQVHLKSDAEIEVSNGASSTIHSPDGTVTTTNGAATVTIDPSGNIQINASGNITAIASGTADITASSSASITAPTVDINGTTFTPGGVFSATSGTIGGVIQETHKHAQGADSDGDAQQDTGGPTNA